MHVNPHGNIVVPVHRFNGSRLEGLVCLHIGLLAYISRIRRRIGRCNINTRKFIKSVFAFSRNKLCRLWHTVFAANEPGHHLPPVWQKGPEGGAYNTVQTCKQSTRNPGFIGKPLLTVNGYK